MWLGARANRVEGVFKMLHIWISFVRTFRAVLLSWCVWLRRLQIGRPGEWRVPSLNTRNSARATTSNMSRAAQVGGVRHLQERLARLAGGCEDAPMRSSRGEGQSTQKRSGLQKSVTMPTGAKPTVGSTGILNTIGQWRPPAQ